ncbi:hypothetical protein AQ1_02246 [alpha proteobacterium Q-1]|nr:hypothetical protein AQ1_02246 [alpha proteobacterium Q-1]
MGKAAGMQCHHAGMNIIAAEKFAFVIKDEFIIIIIIVVKGHLQSPRIAFDGARHEAAHHKTIRHKGCVGAGRQMIAMAHQGANIPPIDPHRQQIPLPAHGIKGIERIGDDGGLPPALHHHPPRVFRLLGLESRIDMGGFKDRGIENGMGTHQPFFRQAIAGIRRLDQHHLAGLVRLDPPHGAARQQNIIAIAIGQMAKIAKQRPRPFMDE